MDQTSLYMGITNDSLSHFWVQDPVCVWGHDKLHILRYRRREA